MSNKALLRTFYELEQFDATQVMYVWIDETGENVRAKTLTIEKCNIDSVEGCLGVSCISHPLHNRTAHMERACEWFLVSRRHIPKASASFPRSISSREQ